MQIEEWRAKGKYIKVNHFNVFYIQHNVDRQAPTICIMHGYPSCSYDFVHVLPFFENKFNVVIHDHLGFGLSEKPKNYAYSLMEQADIALALWNHLNLKNIHIVAHDYSTTVANEIMVRKLHGYDHLNIQSITFCNGSMNIRLAKLRIIQKLLKHEIVGKYIAAMMNKSMYVKNMCAIWFDKNKFNQQEIELLYDFLMYDSCTEVLHRVSTYNNERQRFWNRWIPIFKEVNFPVHLLWAQQDPIAVKAIAETLHNATPNSTYTKIDECGHYPMLEKPEIWANAVIDFIMREENKK